MLQDIRWARSSIGLVRATWSVDTWQSEKTNSSEGTAKNQTTKNLEQVLYTAAAQWAYSASISDASILNHQNN
jgi:hypothetical protein